MRKEKKPAEDRWVAMVDRARRRREGRGMRDRRSLSFPDNLRAAGETAIGGDCGGWTRYIAMGFSRHFSSTSIKRALMGERARVRDIRGGGGESARSYTAANPLCSVSRGAKGRKK